MVHYRSSILLYSCGNCSDFVSHSKLLKEAKLSFHPCICWKGVQLCICSACLNHLFLQGYISYLDKVKTELIHCEKEINVNKSSNQCSINESKLLPSPLSSNLEALHYFPWELIVLSASILYLCLIDMMCLVLTKLLCSLPFLGKRENGKMHSCFHEGALQFCSFRADVVITNSICREDQEQIYSQNIKQITNGDACHENKHFYRQISNTCQIVRYAQHTWLHTAWTKSNYFSSRVRHRRYPSRMQNRSLQSWIIPLLLLSTVFRTINCTVTDDTSAVHKITLFCNQYLLTSLLDNEEMKQCASNGTIDGNCDSSVSHILKRDNLSEIAFRTFSKTLAKYATPQTYSVQWSLQRCKTAYKNWICSVQHPYFDMDHNGSRLQIPPCSSLCMKVAASCPFFRVHNNTKLYGGQPTFLCHGFPESVESEEFCYSLEEMPSPKFGHYEQFEDSHLYAPLNDTEINRRSRVFFRDVTHVFKRSTILYEFSQKGFKSGSIPFHQNVVLILSLNYIFSSLLCNVNVHLDTSS